MHEERLKGKEHKSKGLGHFGEENMTNSVRFSNTCKGLFGEKTRMEWNEDLNPGGLGMELES